MPDKTLRILQVLRAPVGGLFRHVLDLTRGLGERGHAVGLVVDSLASDALTETRLAALSEHAALGIHRIPIPRVLGVRDAVAPLRIRRMAKHFDIDILHGHGAKGGFHARLARIGTRRPIAIYTPHGGALHYSRRSLSGSAFLTLETLLMGQTDAIIFESAYAQRTYARVVGAPTCPQVVVHNGLGESEFAPVPAAPDACDFVFVGELRDIKGIDLLAEAMADLRAPDGRPATLTMAGDGPDRERLEAQIDRLGLGERITLAGVQPAREMFARGRCVVVPSRAESLPYVVLEAAAAQKPVIATAVGGVAEIFGPTAGALVPPDDAAALGRAMQAFLDHPDDVMDAMRARLAFITDRFQLAHMVGKIEDLYFQSLKAR